MSKILSFEASFIRGFVKKKSIQHSLPEKEIQTVVDECFSYGEIDIRKPEHMDYLSERVATHAVFYHTRRHF
jgi:hypothetical protein